MAITHTEFLSDRMRVHFFCPLPWGSGDEYGMVEVLYNSIPTLPPLTSDEIHGDFREVWIESVYVPDLRVTVLFRFAKWQETDDCRMQALAGGPFLVADRGSDQVPDAPQPTA